MFQINDVVVYGSQGVWGICITAAKPSIKEGMRGGEFYDLENVGKKREDIWEKVCYDDTAEKQSSKERSDAKTKWQGKK